MKKYGLTVWNDKVAYTCSLESENDDDAIRKTKYRLGKYDRARLYSPDGKSLVFAQ